MAPGPALLPGRLTRAKIARYRRHDLERAAQIYASTAVLLPLGSALLATVANLGVVTAFLIGATGRSLPEGIVLQRLLGTRYLTVLAAPFVAAAATVGYVVQAIGRAGA